MWQNRNEHDQEQKWISVYCCRFYRSVFEAFETKIMSIIAICFLKKNINSRV